MAKSKRAKATDISQKVKEEVFIRDKGRCICCDSRYAAPNAHYIRRSQGGLGIPQNVVTLCFQCHHDFDNGDKREHHENLIRKHLQMHYEDWDETKLVYDKWRKED